MREVAPGRAIDQIDTHGRELPNQFHGLFDIPASLFPICRRDAQKQREAFRPDFPYRGNDLAQRARPVLERAAAAAGALVAECREERAPPGTTRGVDDAN